MRNITFQSIFDTPADPVGAQYNEIAQTADGRLWTYLHATEAISQHMVVSRPANTTVDLVSSSGTPRVYIKYATGGWTVGAYQHHWAIIDSGTGVGQVGKIKDNTADTLELFEDYALATALAVADSDLTIVHQPDAEKAPVTTSYTSIQGVAQVAFASGDDGWFLVRGIGGVLMGEAGSADVAISPGDNTEGTAELADDGDDVYDNSVIGRIVGTCDTADKANLVDVNIW